MTRWDDRALRRRLVGRLEATGAVRTAAVRGAFTAVPREAFVPEVAAADGLEAVYEDVALVTKRDADGVPVSSSSQPQIMAVMLELLGCRPGDRVLEIGAGTGYNAALLAHLVGPGGTVVTVDIDPAVAAGARAHLVAAGLGGRAGAVEVVHGDGRAGAPHRAPFDRIIATASVPRVPSAWAEQLAPHGTLVAPVWLGERMDHQVVAAFGAAGTGLRSRAVVAGGFMELRGGDGHARPDPRHAVHAAWTAGGRTVTARAHGDVITAMPPAARRRLAALLAEPPRNLGIEPPGRLSLAHLVTLAPRALVQWWLDDRILAGVASDDGTSIAAVGRDAHGRLTAVGAGTDQAELALAEILDRAARRWAAGLDVVLTARRRGGDRDGGDLRIECRWSPTPGTSAGDPGDGSG